MGLSNFASGLKINKRIPLTGPYIIEIWNVTDAIKIRTRGPCPCLTNKPFAWSARKRNGIYPGTKKHSKQIVQPWRPETGTSQGSDCKQAHRDHGSIGAMAFLLKAKSCVPWQGHGSFAESEELWPLLPDGAIAFLGKIVFAWYSACCRSVALK